MPTYGLDCVGIRPSSYLDVGDFAVELGGRPELADNLAAVVLQEREPTPGAHLVAREPDGGGGGGVTGWKDAKGLAS